LEYKNTAKFKYLFGMWSHQARDSNTDLKLWANFG